MCSMVFENSLTNVTSTDTVAILPMATLDNDNDEDAIRCWICLEDLLLDLTGAATTSGDNVGIPPDCVAPCRCKGSSRLVHEACLMEWYFYVCHPNALSL